MPEDVLYLEADFADASACDLVHAMLSGEGPAFKQDVAVRFHSLFLLMESEPVADSAERVEPLRVRASWDPWPNYEQTARALCEACSRAGAIATWAFFADDTGGAAVRPCGRSGVDFADIALCKLWLDRETLFYPAYPLISPRPSSISGNG